MSEDDNSGLTRRRVLGGIATVGAASAAAGAGTMAMFSDSEESTGNAVTAGTLNLDPAGSSDGSSFDMSVGNLAPDDSGKEVGYLDLANTGSVDGILDYEITGWTDFENGQNDAEAAVDSTAGNNAGELSNHLEFRAYVDRSPGNGARNNDAAITNGWVPLSTGRVDTNIPVDAGETVRIWVDARIPSSTGNEVQSDSIDISAEFHLDQA